MQQELEADAPGEVRILGVNDVGFEAGNPAMTAGRSLPWLQDMSDAEVWKLWQVTNRDVIVLDGKNHRRLVFNLTVNNLADPANYAALKQALLDAR